LETFQQDDSGKLLSDEGVRMMYEDSSATTGVNAQAKPK